MSTTTHLEHAYAVFGDDRLNLYASQTALRLLAKAVKALAHDETRAFSLAVIKAPHYGLTFSNLRVTRGRIPFCCTIADDAVVLTGNEPGFERFASTLESCADQWFEGGHSHIYSDENWSGDRKLATLNSMEMLIGGYSYLDDEMFGLPPHKG